MTDHRQQVSTGEEEPERHQAGGDRAEEGREESKPAGRQDGSRTQGIKSTSGAPAAGQDSEGS